MEAGLYGGTNDLLPRSLNALFVCIASVLGVTAIGLGTAWWLKTSEVRRAKEKAREMIRSGRIDDPKSFDVIYNTLAKTRYNSESAELMRRLRTLRVKTPERRE
ncbi:MAG: hypothetical protein V1894_01610 [Chloroflexota bacterium]